MGSATAETKFTLGEPRAWVDFTAHLMGELMQYWSG
jgi:hypothetical protein